MMYMYLSYSLLIFQKTLFYYLVVVIIQNAGSFEQKTATCTCFIVHNILFSHDQIKIVPVRCVLSGRGPNSNFTV